MATVSVIKAPSIDPAATSAIDAEFSPSITTDESLPCPYKQALLLQQALASDKMRVGFFLGAGCPLAVDVPPGIGTWPLIPNIEGLTERIRKTVGESNDCKKHFETILKHLKDSPTSKKTVEDLLTRIRGLIEVIDDDPFDGMCKDDLLRLDKAICTEIDKAIRRRLPSRSTPYHQLAAWIGSEL